MSKVTLKFVNDLGNLSSKGFKLNNDYEAERQESKNNPGHFFYAFTNPQIALWEAQVTQAFKDIGKPAPQQAAQQPKQEASSQAQATFDPRVFIEHLTNLNKGLHIVLDEIKKSQSTAEKDKEVILESVYTVINNLPASSAVAAQPGTGGEKDIFFSSLNSLDFEMMNLKIVKIDGKPSISISMDGMAPLNLQTSAFSGIEFAEQVKAAFSEATLITSSIRSWKAKLQEQEKELADKTKKASEKTKAADKPAAEKKTRGSATKSTSGKAATSKTAEEKKEPIKPAAEKKEPVKTVSEPAPAAEPNAEPVEPEMDNSAPQPTSGGMFDVPAGNGLIQEDIQDLPAPDLEAEFQRFGQQEKI